MRAVAAPLILALAGAPAAGPVFAGTPPATGPGTAALEIGGFEWNPEAVAALSGPLAFQVWRDGNVDVFLLDPAARTVTRLTDHAATDRYPAFAPGGRRLAFVSDRGGEEGVYAVDVASGEVEALAVGEERQADPAFSPDGRTLLVTRGGRLGQNLIALDLAGGGERALTRSRLGRNALGRFDPSGERIAFSRNRGPGGWQVHVLDLGTRERTQVTDDPGACRPDWSPDGERIAYVTQRWDGKGDIAVSRPDGSGLTRVTFADEAYDYFPAWTPDGRWIVYATTSAKDKGPDRSGPWHLALADPDGGGTRWLSRSAWSEAYPAVVPAAVTPGPAPGAHAPVEVRP